MRKGQAAMEFLMTYGWAILVVLIAVGALAYFGVLNPDRLLGEKCTISTGSGLFCGDYRIVDGGAGSDVATIRTKNILTKSVQVAVTSNFKSSGGVICPATVVCINADVEGDIVFTCAAATYAPGAKAKGDLTIIYTPYDSSGCTGTAGLQKSTTGNLIATVQ